jgi:hypothetical protein
MTVEIISHIVLDPALDLEALLEEIVQGGNYQQFVSLVETIDWSSRRPDELTKVIDLALSLEMTKLARKLAQVGGRLFPDHERVQQAAKVLSPLLSPECILHVLRVWRIQWPGSITMPINIGVSG